MYTLLVPAAAKVTIFVSQCNIITIKKKYLLVNCQLF
ncbi:hypothetical protein FLB_04050 [Flavobacterium succinicans]|uniref:Uncharacterized protein n=1 Tax=Flavobacterium succinicans TaxID=29536 RepID=A0A199XVC5_9FLAO|nr:hypothetical protein FLB_04050 [Flavobacterium succinicans]